MKKYRHKEDGYIIEKYNDDWDAYIDQDSRIAFLDESDLEKYFEPMKDREEEA